MRKHTPLTLSSWVLGLTFVLTNLGTVTWAADNYYSHGVELYNAGRFSDANDAFDMAIKKKDHASDSTAFIERIRKETVERIRNKALTGISKSNWQTKYYYMNVMNGRVRVGISLQEVFEPGSLNFRPGALDALSQVAASIAKADTLRVDVDLVNETNQETIPNTELTSQQQAVVFSYLSLAARSNLPKY